LNYGTVGNIFEGVLGGSTRNGKDGRG
jgi:hypothetical protein